MYKTKAQSREGQGRKENFVLFKGTCTYLILLSKIYTTSTFSVPVRLLSNRIPSFSSSRVLARTHLVTDSFRFIIPIKPGTLDYGTYVSVSRSNPLRVQLLMYSTVQYVSIEILCWNLKAKSDFFNLRSRDGFLLIHYHVITYLHVPRRDATTPRFGLLVDYLTVPERLDGLDG